MVNKLGKFKIKGASGGSSVSQNKLPYDSSFLDMFTFYDSSFLDMFTF